MNESSQTGRRPPRRDHDVDAGRSGAIQRDLRALLFRAQEKTCTPDMNLLTAQADRGLSAGFQPAAARAGDDARGFVRAPPIPPVADRRSVLSGGRLMERHPFLFDLLTRHEPDTSGRAGAPPPAGKTCCELLTRACSKNGEVDRNGGALRRARPTLSVHGKLPVRSRPAHRR